MNDSFPIPIPDRLPHKITPCPIVEAVLEVRFITSEPWRTLPGLLYANIRARYPKQRDLPLSQMPDELFRRDPLLAYQPLIQFHSDAFIIQFGPRVISLVTQPNNYPGWPAVKEEMKWLLDQLRTLNFIAEGERLAVRYINFLADDVFSNLILSIQIAEKQLLGVETSITTTLSRKPLTARLQVANNARLGTEPDVRQGSLFDVDVWIGPLDFELYADGLSKFDDAHRLAKEIFFGLLKPEALVAFKPEYQ